ncbi:MAG: hypothetical protein ACXWRE_02740 [Pseudobdellovibrionaceae bacterium]
MNSKIIASMALFTLIFSVNAKAETYCTQNQISTLEIANGKGSLIQTNSATGQTHVIKIASVAPDTTPSESSDNSLWGQPVIKTESFIFQGSLDGSTEVHTGGIIKFYLKNGDVALLFVGGELQNSNLGTKNSCK